jgi:hypothetical protein
MHHVLRFRHLPDVDDDVCRGRDVSFEIPRGSLTNHGEDLSMYKVSNKGTNEVVIGRVEETRILSLESVNYEQIASSRRHEGVDSP